MYKSSTVHIVYSTETNRKEQKIAGKRSKKNDLTLLFLFAEKIKRKSGIPEGIERILTEDRESRNIFQPREESAQCNPQGSSSIRLRKCIQHFTVRHILINVKSFERCIVSSVDREYRPNVSTRLADKVPRPHLKIRKNHAVVCFQTKSVFNRVRAGRAVYFRQFFRTAVKN